ncbi:MAG: thioesterase family protein [Myxococcales bacterium]|nr:thioesterase family protein [Myxococcales bacterium]
MTAPASTTPFAVASAVDARGDGFLARVPEDWTQGRGAFGGLIAAQGLRALSARVPPERALRSVVVDFVSPAVAGPVEVEVRLLRAGRALTHAEARIVQAGETCAVVVAAFGASRPSTLALAPASPPAAPPAEALARFPYVEGFTPAFTQHFDFRWASDRFPFAGASVANVGGWIRHAAPTPVDAAALLALVDAWPAPVLPLLPARVPASTVTWMVDLAVAPPAAGFAPEAWWRFEADGIAASDGYATVDGRMWDDRGRLVAASRQSVAVFG